MTGFLAWLLENIVWASAAMLLVLALRGPVTKAFGAGPAYALWLIPLCRLLAPPADWLAAPLPPLPSLTVLLSEDATPTPLPLDGAVAWLPVLIAVWIGGAFLFLGVQVVRHHRFMRRLYPLARIGAHRSILLLSSARAEGPLALGIVRRAIVVPADFETRYSPNERAFALDHEAYHHRRGDIAINHFALLVLALNWCNPLAWLAFRAFRADQELSCDAAITGAATARQRSDYAHALVKSASPTGLVSACPLNSADQLKRRLKMLPAHHRAPRRLLAGGAFALSLAAAGLLAGSPVRAQETQAGAADPARGPTRVIIVEREGAAPPSTPDALERRPIRLRRNADGTVSADGLDPEIRRRIEGCRDGNSALFAPDQRGDGSERPSVIVCTSDSRDGVANVELLQRVRDRMAENTDLSAETKQRLLAELDRTIARARSGN